MSWYKRQLRGMLEAIAADISTPEVPVSIGEVTPYLGGEVGVVVFAGIASRRIKLSTAGNTAQFREEARMEIAALAAEES